MGMKDGFIRGLELLLSGDKELYTIIGLSLIVSLSATVLASIMAIPLATWLGRKSFRGKKLFSRIAYASMSLPSVVVGLVILLLLARRGVLGSFQLLYTPVAMIIAQWVLISPFIFGLTYHTVIKRGKQIEKEGHFLGARGWSLNWLIIRELRHEMVLHVMAGFSRAISEVGAVMIVGGNIKGETRVMTTAIALHNSMGDYGMAIALGMVLLFTAFLINSLVFQEEKEG